MQKFFDCGIDLGTTNSCIAITDSNGNVQIIDNTTDTMPVTPSAIKISGKGTITIGRRAYQSDKVEDLAVQFKRGMGTDKKYHFASANIDKLPEELSSEILMQVKSDAEKRLMKKIENAVITVPAAFKTLQVEATNKAGSMAGFKNVLLLQEPIAAAIAYGAKPDAANQYWMVFDYGGGTLDVAIVSTKDGRLEVLNSEGDNYFGGSDVDRMIFSKIVVPELINNGYSVEKLFDESTKSGKSNVRRVLLACETCKLMLSSSTEAYIEELTDGSLCDDNDEPIECEIIMTQKQLNELIADTVDKAIEFAKKALNGAGITEKELNKVILVGGSTQIPYVRDKLKSAFSAELDCSLDPMTVVAKGAAIYASTAVIDVDVDPNSVPSGKVLLNLTYEPVSSKENEEVIGKIENIAEVHVARVKIDSSDSVDFSGANWSSGWVDIDPENGVFFFDVKLDKNKVNHFKVSACDDIGSDIPVENALFDIKQSELSLKLSGHPATASVGIVVHNPITGYDFFDILIKKNTPLPTEATRTYKAIKELKPGDNDSIHFMVCEGENTDNPGANCNAGDIYINGSDISKVIPKDAQFEITLSMDEQRVITVEGYFPDLDYSINTKALRPESKFSLEKRLDEIHAQISETRNILDKLRSNDIDVSDLEEALDQLDNAYDDTYDLIDSDEAAVEHYVSAFYDVQTSVIKLERANSKQAAETSYSERIERARKQVSDWGNNNDQDELDKLEESFQYAKSDEEKEYIANKIDTIGFNAMISNFNWLKGFFMLALAKPETKYTNYNQAEYWKTQGYEAIDRSNTSQLQNAVIKLLGLLPKGNNVLAKYHSDLSF